MTITQNILVNYIYLLLVRMVHLCRWQILDLHDMTLALLKIHYLSYQDEQSLELEYEDDFVTVFEFLSVGHG